MTTNLCATKWRVEDEHLKIYTTKLRASLL